MCVCVFVNVSARVCRKLSLWVAFVVMLTFTNLLPFSHSLSLFLSACLLQP